jgi:hypothetical protein
MSASSPRQVIALALVAIFAFSLCVSAQTNRRVRKPAAPAPTKAETPAEKPEEVLFKRGIAFFQGAHYEDSIITFKQLIASYPQTPYTDLAYTYAIQSMVKLELYSEASELLDKFKAAYPGSPLGASLTKEILNAKMTATASKPAIPVAPPDEANPFASMAKDAQQVDISTTGNAASNSTSSGGVPPPTSLRRNKTSDDYMTGGQTSAVPPPTGLRNPTASDLRQKNPGKNDSRRDTSAAPLPTDVAGANTDSPQRTGNSSGGRATSNVPPPTKLKNQPSEISSTGRSPYEETVLPVTPVQMQLARTTTQGEAGKVVTFPILIKNTGAIDEAYKLGTTLPSSFESAFVLDDNKNGRVDSNELSAQLTPTLAPGASTSVILVLRVPKANTGRVDFRVTVESVMQHLSPAFSDITLMTTGGDPAVTVDLDFDKTNVRRGHTFNYVVKINNNTDLPIRMVRLNYTFEDGYTFQNAKPTEGIYSNDIHTATWDIAEIPARSTVPITIRIAVAKNAEAGDGIIGYGTLHAAGIAPMQIGGAPVTIDDKAAGANAQVAPIFRELKGAPREVVFIPYIIRNNGDHRDAFDVKVEPFGGIVFLDANRDGVYQPNEISISRTPELDPGKDCQVLVRAEVPSSLGGTQQFPYKLVATSAIDGRVTGSGTSYVTLAVPRVTIKRVQSDVQGGGLAYYEITITNEGSGEAKGIVVHEFMLPGNEFINASVSPTVTGNARSEGQRLEWKIDSLMPGASRTYRVAVKRNSNAPTPERAVISYFDASGNQYAGQ